MGPKTFVQAIVLQPVPSNPSKRPTETYEKELSSQDFGKEIEFTVVDDIPTVTAKTYAAFEVMLSSIMGGIQLYVQEPGHTLNIRRSIRLFWETNVDALMEPKYTWRGSMTISTFQM